MTGANEVHNDRLEMIETNREVAEEILVRAGLLNRCDSCHEATGTLHPESDLTAAYAIASAMFRDRDVLVDGYARQDVLSTIKAIGADCAMECQCMRRKD